MGLLNEENKVPESHITSGVIKGNVAIFTCGLCGYERSFDLKTGKTKVVGQSDILHAGWAGRLSGMGMEMGGMELAPKNAAGNGFDTGTITFSTN